MRINSATLLSALFPFLLAPAALAQVTTLPIPLRAGWTLEDAAKTTATGAEVSVPAYKTTSWYKATVPGTVLTSLVNDGVYPEPLYGENNRPDKIPESLCRTSYWYRTQFTVPANYVGKHVWLNFDGINYAAEVWVNGRSVGSIEGAFARGKFDVTAFVTAGKTATVAVKILPPPHPGTPLEQTIANGTGPNGGITAIDGPTFLCTIGWDWIPGIRDRDMGIWQDVTLSASGPVVIEDPYVTSDIPLPRTDSADVIVQTTLRNVSDAVVIGNFSANFGNLVVSRSVALQPHESQMVILSPATQPLLRFQHPRLWWPNGYGAPNLYRVHLAFGTVGGVSDTKDVSFGIRKITYFVPGSETMTLSVNGVQIVCKGGAWGMDEAMKRISAKRLDAQVRMHRDANYTMIRDWVGQSTSEEFYSACDRYGILLWDEFFQANPSDGPNPADSDLYLANVREKLLRYRNHPSIAVWCARNEGNPPPEIDAGIAKLIAEVEKDRLYQKNSDSGHGVHSGGPYRWRTPREYYAIDAPFKTELGSVSIPTLESIKAMMPEKDWNTINDDWAEHDLCRGAQAGDVYPRMLTDRFGPIASLADFARKGQMANYEAFRSMYEGRFVKLFRPTTGVLTWMSNPSQPSFVWQIYCHDLEPNSALFAARSGCESLHIMMSELDGRLSIINEMPTEARGLSIKTSIYNLDGSLALSSIQRAVAPPLAATEIGAVALPAGVSPVHFVAIEMRDAGGTIVSRNFYWSAKAETPDDFRALQTMPLVRLQAATRLSLSDGRLRISVTLTNPTKFVALMAHLQLRNQQTGARVLPVFYTDNYVSLTPGQSRAIQIDAAESDLGNGTPQIVVDGWNVEVQKAEKDAKHAVAITTNTAAEIAPVAASSVAAPPMYSNRPINIDCGGSGSGFFTFGKPTSPDDFDADEYFRNGSAAAVNVAVDTSVPHAAPAFVYETERSGPSRYSIPAARSGAHKTFLVRLHFADTTFQRAGQRKFNVDINGVRVLTEFDIIAEAGAPAMAVVKEFPGIVPDGRGNVAVALSNGSADQPEIRGIQVIGE